MPSCSLIGCGKKKTKDSPFTLHRLPTQEQRQKKWLELLGKGNISTRVKYIYICSLHFDENCFNRTMDVIRLRDDALPNKYEPPPPIEKTKRRERNRQSNNISIINQSKASALVGKLILAGHDYLATSKLKGPVKIATRGAPSPPPSGSSTMAVPVAVTENRLIIDTASAQSSSRVTRQTRNKRIATEEACEDDSSTDGDAGRADYFEVEYLDDDLAVESAKTTDTSTLMLLKTATQSAPAPPFAALVKDASEVRSRMIRERKLKKLQNQCDKYRKMIKRLHEQVRRQNVKMDTYINLINALKERNPVNKEYFRVIKDCARFENLLNRRYRRTINPDTEGTIEMRLKETGSQGAEGRVKTKRILSKKSTGKNSNAQKKSLHNRKLFTFLHGD